ncbi:hypothetical protein FOZ60_007308, partial [Perkinsus olseni]
MVKLLGIVVVFPAVVNASSPEKRLGRKRLGPESRPADETKEYLPFPKKTAEEMMGKAFAEYKDEGRGRLLHCTAERADLSVKSASLNAKERLECGGAVRG